MCVQRHCRYATVVLSDGDTRPLPTAGGGAPALSVKNLSKRFGDRLAFDDVSFDVGRGEVFGFLGPNGAGKTTTVRTLGTLLAPTSGSATVAGLPLTPENGVEIRRRIAIMPESPGLYLRLSVAREPRVLRRPVRGARPARSHRRARCEPSTWPTGHSDACGTLSKGLRQRVALAQGAAQRPGSAVPRRADRGPRPGRGSGGPRADRRAPEAGRHDLPDHPSARGGGAPVRPRRDPEHDPAHDRPARRAPRPAVRQDAHGQDPRRRSPSRTASSAACRPSTAGARTAAPATCSTVSDPDGRRAGRHPGAGGGRAPTSSRSASRATRSRTSTSS